MNVDILCCFLAANSLDFILIPQFLQKCDFIIVAYSIAAGTKTLGSTLLQTASYSIIQNQGNCTAVMLKFLLLSPYLHVHV